MRLFESECLIGAWGSVLVHKYLLEHCMLSGSLSILSRSAFLTKTFWRFYARALCLVWNDT